MHVGGSVCCHAQKVTSPPLSGALAIAKQASSVCFLSLEGTYARGAGLYIPRASAQHVLIVPAKPGNCKAASRLKPLVFGRSTVVLQALLLLSTFTSTAFLRPMRYTMFGTEVPVQSHGMEPRSQHQALFQQGEKCATATVRFYLPN